MGHTMNTEEGEEAGGTRGSKGPRSQKPAEEHGGMPKGSPMRGRPASPIKDSSLRPRVSENPADGFSLSAEMVTEDGRHYPMQAKTPHAAAPIQTTPAKPPPEAPPLEQRRASPKMANAVPPPPLELRAAAPARRKKKPTAPMPDITSREWQNSIADSLLSAKVPKTASSNTYSIKANFNTTGGSSPGRTKAAAPAAPIPLAMTHPPARAEAANSPSQPQLPQQPQQQQQSPEATAAGSPPRRDSREGALGDRRASGLQMDEGVAGSLFPGRDMVRQRAAAMLSPGGGRTPEGMEGEQGAPPLTWGQQAGPVGGMAQGQVAKVAGGKEACESPISIANRGDVIPRNLVRCSR